MPPRRKQAQTRVPRGFRFSEEAMTALDQLVKKYEADAPSYITLSQRVVIEALVDYATRTELPFSTLFGAAFSAGGGTEQLTP